MSNVDNYIITMPAYGDDFDILKGSSFELELQERQKGTGFNKVEGHAGGYKAFEHEVWMFASNYFGLEQMAQLLVKHRSVDYDGLQLLHSSQSDRSFTLYDWDALEAIANKETHHGNS